MAGTRKIAAILVADIVGYSRLAAADEDRTLARLRGLRSDLIDPAIEAHHGRIVKRTGDGSLIEFRSVVDAVRCAIEVQNGLIERNAGLPPELAGPSTSGAAIANGAAASSICQGARSSGLACQRWPRMWTMQIDQAIAASINKIWPNTICRLPQSSEVGLKRSAMPASPRNVPPRVRAVGRSPRSMANGMTQSGVV